MLPLSIVIITLNEADRLPVLLPKVIGWAAEVVVVDSGSTDGTQQIAADYGCRLIHHDFEGNGRQKRFAVEQAAHDWVLALDADEVPDEALLAHISKALAQHSKPLYDAYRLKRRFYFLNREMKYGGETRRTYIRLFRKSLANFDNAAVHDQVQFAGPTGLLGGYLAHYSYRSLSDYLARFNNYTTRTAAEMAAKGKSPKPWQVYLRFPITFIHLYLLRGLFMDGHAGFMWAILSAMYPVVKYAKHIEISQSRQP